MIRSAILSKNENRDNILAHSILKGWKESSQKYIGTL